MGKYWCTQRGIAIKSFPAKWEEWEGLPAGRIKLRQYANRNAFYNILAGHNRNIDMANYAEALIAITQGNSAGTRNMIALALSRKLKTYVVTLNGDGSYRCGVHVGGHDIVELF